MTVGIGKSGVERDTARVVVDTAHIDDNRDEQGVSVTDGISGESEQDVVSVSVTVDAVLSEHVTAFSDNAS